MQSDTVVLFQGLGTPWYWATWRQFSDQPRLAPLICIGPWITDTATAHDTPRTRSRDQPKCVNPLGLLQARPEAMLALGDDASASGPDPSEPARLNPAVDTRASAINLKRGVLIAHDYTLAGYKAQIHHQARVVEVGPSQTSDLARGQPDLGPCELMVSSKG